MLSLLLTLGVISLLCWFFFEILPKIKVPETHGYDKYNAEIDKKLKGWL